MRCTGDVGELAVVPGLDAEPAEVDLTRDGLGDACLDMAVVGMFVWVPTPSLKTFWRVT